MLNAKLKKISAGLCLALVTSSVLAYAVIILACEYKGIICKVGGTDCTYIYECKVVGVEP